MREATIRAQRVAARNLHAFAVSRGEL